MLKAVIFDMDGLLLDTETLAMEAWLQAAKLCNVPLDRQILLRTIGVNWAGTQRILTEALGPDLPLDEMRAKVQELYHGWINNGGVRAKPGAAQLLRALKDGGIPMGLATSTSRSGATARLRSVGLFDYFSGAACGDEITNGKPAPDIFLLSAERIGVAPELCAAMEDSPAGIRAAKRAGMTTFMVPDLVQPDEETLTFVDHLVSSLAEAQEILFQNHLTQSGSCRK